MRKFFTIAILALSINGFTQQWTNKAPMPTTRGGASAAVVNNIIYVIGGGDDKAQLPFPSNLSSQPSHMFFFLPTLGLSIIKVTATTISGAKNNLI
jgi:hypothetical protein